MDKRNWKIIYTSYKGMEKKAVELINKEMGALILRDAGIYRIHVLPCEQVNNAVIDKNVVVVGLYDENEIIRKLRDDWNNPDYPKYYGKSHVQLPNWDFSRIASRRQSGNV